MFFRPLFYPRLSFSETEQLQNSLSFRCKTQNIGFLFCFTTDETVTAGLGIRSGEIIQELRDQNLVNKVNKVRRGGRLTMYGPQQIICYPIVPLNLWQIKIQDFISLIEISLIQWLRQYNIDAVTRQGLTGIWIREAVSDQGMKQNTMSEQEKYGKICSIGIGVRQGITNYGFALNYYHSAELFEGIVPCGNVRDSMVSFQEKLEAKLQTKNAAHKTSQEDPVNSLGMEPTKLHVVNEWAHFIRMNLNEHDAQKQ